MGSSLSPWARCSTHRHPGKALPPARPAATAPRPAAGSLWAEEVQLEGRRPMRLRVMMEPGWPLALGLGRA